MKIPTGGPAYPRPASVDQRSGTLCDGDVLVPEQDGMTLLDHMIGQALCGLLSSPECIRELTEEALARGIQPPDALGRAAVNYALATMKERERIFEEIRKAYTPTTPESED